MPQESITDGKHFVTEIKKKPETNKRSFKYEMNESLLCILPRYLLMLISSMLNDLVAKLQIACSDGNSTDNSPLKQALELLRERQQNLYDHIYHEMSPKEQLYYVCMIDVLNKSLIEYQGSLEQLQSTHEVAMLVKLLLHISRSSPESDLGHQVVGHDVFLLLISAFSSVIYDQGIYFVQQPTVAEALESVEVHSAFMQIYTTGTHDIKYTTEGKELCATQDENGSSPQTVNSKREGSYDNKKVLGIAAEARFYQTQDKKAEEFCPTQGESDSSLIVSQRKEVLTESDRHQSSSQSLDMEVQDSVRFIDSAAGVDHASQREDSEFPSSLSQIVDKNTGEVLNCKNLKDYVSFSLVLQFIFANFFYISRKLKSIFKKGGRDGYKRTSVPNTWDMDVQPSFVTDVEMPSHKPDSSSSIPTEIIFPDKGDETLPLKTMTQQTFVKVNKAQNLSLERYEHDRPISEVLVSPFSRWSKGLHLQQLPLVLPVSAVSHNQAISANQDLVVIADLIVSTYETISTSVSRASAISSSAHQWAISPYRAIRGDLAVSADLFTPPPLQPLVSWCWKKRIDKLSVADLLHFTQEANIIALTELDTECHETICHAIVSEITAPSSFTLIHALHERSQCFFSTQDKNGDIPLHIAVVSGHIMVVKQLVDLHPAAVHILNNKHATPVDIAMDLKHHDVVDCLLRGVVQQDPHSTSTVQLLQSCLLKAMKTGYTHCLQVLLQLQSEYGLTIDFECTDSDGHTGWYYLKQKEHSVQASVVNILRSSSPSDFLLLCKLFRMKILDIRMFPQLLQQDNTDTCRSNGTYTPQNDLSEANLDQEAMKVPVACNAEHCACNFNVELENYKSEQTMVQVVHAAVDTCEKESIAGDSTTDALVRKENSFCKERGFSCNDYITKSKRWELEIQEDAAKLQDQWSSQRDEPICPTSPTTHYDGDLPTFYKMALDEEYPPSERPIQINHTLDSDNGDTQWSYKSSQPSSLTLSDVPCMPPTPDPAVVEAMNSNIILQYSSTEDSNNATKKLPFMYQQQYTDSVTSSPCSVDPSPPRVRTISKAKRARAKRRLFQHRMPTSGSDIKEESFGKINQHRRRRRQRTARRDVRSESYTDYESSSNHTDFDSSSSCSSKEDSEISRQIDDEVTMNHSTESITGHQSQFSSAMHVVGIKPCVNAKLREKYSPRRKHKLRSTSNACLTEHYFCSIDGTKLSFNSDHFKVWLSSFIHNSGYCRLKRQIHPQLLTVFGFCPLKRSYLTTIQKKMARAIIEVGSQCKKNAIPKKVVQNLMVLEKFVFKDHQGTMPSVLLMLFRGKGQRNCKKDAMAKNKSTGTEAQKRPTNFNGAANHCDSLVSQDKYTKSSSENSSEVPTQNVAQEVSSGENVLQFSSASNPLDVIHSHMKVYSKCCVRHDIHNIIVFGTTIPPSDIFGPKRRYASAKDLRSDQKHGDLNSLQEILAKSGNRQYPDQESRQVMLDSPVPESTRKGRLALPHTATNTIEAHLDDSSHNNSRQHDSLSTHVVTENQVDQIERKVTNGYEIQRTTEPQYQHKHLAPATTASSTHQHSFRTSRALQFNDTPPPEPDDHKDRLQSTAELLHAQDYGRIIDLAYGGEPPSFFSTELKIPYIFITGLAYYKMSNHKKSVQYFQICLEMAEECHRDGDVTICNIYIGDIDFSKRKYTDAAVRYQSALYHYSRDSVAKDFRMILPTKSAVWLKCGSAFKNGSRMGDAVAAYEKAVELASSKKDQLSAHTSLGNLFQGIGENGRAMKEYEAAIVLATELEDNISLGWNHGNLGNALLGLHQRDKALYHLFKALDMAVVHEMTPQAIGRAYNNLGTAFQSLNELSKAEEQYDLALAQAIYGNDIAGQARVYGNIGNLQMLSKQYDRAVPHYTEVMRLSQDKATITTAHHNRGCAYYDWAEKKKKAFFARTIAGFSSHSGTSIQELSSTSESPRNKIKSLNVDSAVVPLGSQKDSASEDTSVMNHSPGFKVSLHGPDFKRCEEIYKPMFVPEGVQKYYLQGTRDLDYVIRHHEENFSGIKGSPKGLSLSVSLFESNSRTFHRMQDCLVHLQKSDDQPSRFEDALLVAEQCRARTLGELLLKRRGPQLEHQLKSPPSIHQLKSIVARQSCPVVYLSYTGERLLGWILYPTPDNECTINMFEVPLSDTEFDGKSFDYHLRYSLNEQLVEKSFEMYKPFDHQKDKTEPLEKLYDLVAQPLMTMLSKLDKQKQKEEDGSSSRDRSKPNTKVDQSSSKVRKIIIIPDSYTNLLPFTCVLDKETGKFWGDSYYFQIMPSLLTMGISDQLPTVAVSIPVQYQQMLCVVGNPTIPRFKFNNNDWDLGKLPHATKEAEWVSHILKCNPILHEQATKDAVMMRLMNAKVIHLATHGSAASGFLAFAGMNSSTKEAIDAKKVLIYPEEVESLNISPALVVLSSCDSGRGVFKADGIQGMARAFILAGAQAVLTALWRVPDESACIFMQFFYQYLVDGLRGTEALHKAILSLRCFSKYSQYIHWSGYQLTGREFQFNINQSPARAELTTRLGTSSVFPRLEILKELEAAFMNNPRPPTDVQVLHGPPGVKPSEPLIDFIHCNHLYFTGGIFWINCRTPQLIEASLTSITNGMGVNELSELESQESKPSLVVLDSLDSLPKNNNPLLGLLRDVNRHIVIISKSNFSPEGLQKSIDCRLLRGTNTITVDPLSTIHATQRMVHSVLKNHHLAPSTQQQALFERLAEFTTGSPPILDLTSSLLGQSLSQTTCTEDVLDTFAENVLTKIPDPMTAVRVLIEQCDFTSSEQQLLSQLPSCPIPTSSIFAKASHQPLLASSLHSKLEKTKILKVYPNTVVYHPKQSLTDTISGFMYLPEIFLRAFCSMLQECTQPNDDSSISVVTYKPPVSGQTCQMLEYCHKNTIPRIIIGIYFQQEMLCGNIFNGHHHEEFEIGSIREKALPQLCQILMQKLDNLKTSSVQKVTLVIDAQTNLFAHAFIEVLQEHLINQFYFQVIPFPHVMPDIESPHYVLLNGTHLNACVVGNPQSIQDTSLPFATEEAMWVSNMLKCEPILHENATKERVMNAMENAELIHLATHANEKGNLVLANTKDTQDDNIVTPKDIKSIKFAWHPILVFLSCCDTTVTSIGAAGIEGIVLAFFEAGAKAVISTVSKVPDQSSFELVKFFYQYLERGIKATESLHRAMLDVRSLPEFAHPSHWRCYRYNGWDFQLDHSTSA